MNINSEAKVQAWLTQIKTDEKGWHTALDTGDKTYSREVVEGNLRQLESLRSMLLGRLVSMNARRQQVMRTAIADGIVTDHISDGVCEQLLSEGWLERAGTLPVRRHVSRSQAFLPTEKAVEGWETAITT